MTLSPSNPRAKPRWALLALLVTLALFGTSIAVTMATLPGTSFNAADGNLSIQGSETDWNSFESATVAAATNFAQQGDAGYAYAGGIKHDTACPALSGTPTTESVHNKSDFTRMYIAYEDIAGDTFLYLAWQRVPQNTDTASAHASFIFAQSETLCANGVTPVRTAGDLLVTYDFDGGSTGQATVGLSRWITTGSGSNCETSKTVPCWSDVTTFAANSVIGEGSVNHRTKNGPPQECEASKNPLGAVYDAIQDQCLGTVEFGEAAINLTDAGVFDTTQACVSFGSVHVGSRASGNSFDAQLKDLIVPLPIELTNCAGIEITKTDDAGSPLENVTFTLHEDDNGEPGDATSMSCTTDADGVCTIDDVLVGTYWVVETNLPAGHDPDGTLPYLLVITEDDVDTTIELAFVNPRERGSVLIHKVDESDPPTLLAGASFELDGEPMTEYDDGVFCADGLLAGTYTVSETEAPSEYEGAVDQDVAAVVPSTCQERIDDEDAPDATFVNRLLNPELSITKEADRSSYSAVGDVINYTVTATNTGESTLTNVDVTDELLDGLADWECDPATPVASLAVGASIICTASYTIAQADLDGGSVFNQACADSDQTDEVCDEVTVPLAELEITKEADRTSYSAVGDMINYTVTATNTGESTLTNVDVTDELLDGLADWECDPATPVASLAVGASIICTASYTIAQADLDEGSVFNQACVDSDETDEVCDDVTVRAGSISIVKTADPTSAVVGSEFTYTFVVTNTGTVTLTDVQATDDTCSPLVLLDPPGWPVAAGTLAPDESVTFTCSMTHDEAGSVTNTVTATAEDPDGNEVTDEDEQTVTVDPASPTFTTAQSFIPNDSATLIGGYFPTGTLTFSLFGPGNATCTGTPAFTETVDVDDGNNTYWTSNTTFTATAEGTWRWVVTYSGDLNNDPFTLGCGHEQFTIQNSPPSP